MRYNSLRSQLNWHSRQQTHIFKKLNKNSNEKQPQPLYDNQDQEEHQLKGNELIWLEKMMKELHHYKQQASDKESKSKKAKQGEALEGIVRQKCGNNYKQTKNAAEKQQKIVVNLDEKGRSSKKIKFEIVLNPDKSESAKKVPASQSKSKLKSAKKPVSKTIPKKTNIPEKKSTNKQMMSSSKDVTYCCPSNTKVIEIDDIKTDPYSFKSTDLQVLEELWRKQSQVKEKPGESQPKLVSKKSIGKIIRNNDKLNKTCVQIANKQPQPSNQQPSQLSSHITTATSHQNSIYKQYKQSRNKQSSIHSYDSKEIPPFQPKESREIKLNSIEKPSKELKPTQPKGRATPQAKQKYEKIYIKLQTQKLSEYLTEKSQVKVDDEPNDYIIETNQYEKYCPTKRIEHPVVTPQPQDSQKKCLTNQRIQNENEISKTKEQSAPRAKSQQRKLNKFAQIIRPTKLFDVESRCKVNTRSIQQSIIVPNAQSSEKQPDNRSQIKLKRKYNYKQQEMPSKAQKLFTLHSVSSDYSSCKEEQKEPPIQIIEVQQQFQPSLSLQMQQQPSSLNKINASVICPQIQSSSQLSLVQSYIKQSLVVRDNEPSKNDLTQQLTTLFNFLDQGHRGLLTDTNCLHESLTEELKLLFSVIINQIRTKKRFYNLQKFIEQSKQIIEIKNEVYNSNNRSSDNKNMVYQILKENMDLLKKKLPLMFVNYTYTQSCFENSNIHSKKNSVSYGQSFVIDKVEIDRNIPRREIQDCIFSQDSKEKAESEDACRKAGVNERGDRSRKDKENIQKYEGSFRKYSRRDEAQSEIDILQPEIYLEKKYGFNKGQEQNCQASDKMSTIFLKTRGYLQNLDNYLKMR